MNLRKTALATPAALAALALVGCGGGSDNNNQAAATSVQAGQTQTSKVLVDGVEIQKTTYRWYSVTDDKGSLSDQPLAKAADEANLPHVLITESIRTSGNSAAPAMAVAYASTAPVTLPTTLAEYKSCYSQFWQGMQKYYPSADKALIAKRLNDFNMTVDELCVKQASSKLTMDEYIEMFQVVAKYWPNDSQIEGKIADFFTYIRVTPGTFKQTLAGMGFTWEDFARRLKNETSGATKFANEYQLSALAFEPFLRNYMAQHQPGPVVALIQNKLQSLSHTLAQSFSPQLLQAFSGHRILAQQATPVSTYTDAANAITDTVNKVWSLGKDVWNFIDTKTGKQSVDDATARSSILSAASQNELDYEFAKTNQTKVVSFVGEGLLGIGENYRVDMQLQADYGATNPNFGGQWVPNFNVVVKQVKADWGYSITGDAQVTNVVNRGSANDPIPEAQVDLKLVASNVSVNRQNFSFIVNGATGAVFKPN